MPINKTEEKGGVKTFHAKTRKDWRNWLIKNHEKEKSIWLIIYKKESSIKSIYYDEAVDEALCFGWIDSKPNKRDDESFFQFFSKRNPKSNWSAVNKKKVEKLIETGLMTKVGFAMIELAKKTGTWTALDEVENLKLPEDLLKALKKEKSAFINFDSFPRSIKRGILEWIQNAKKPETRQKRIDETATLAAKNIRANQYNK
jgi:uncharacterized protein YdeI (YjbR/CyaY-like superfamily)